MGLFDIFTDTIGIDPGSQNLRIIKNEELLFNDSSEISLNKETGHVSGIGKSIRLMKEDVLLRPINCFIEDFTAYEHYLRTALKKNTNKVLISYIVYYCIPTNSTEVEKRAYIDSAEHAGAKEVYVLYQAYTSAIGMGILFEKRNFVLVDFGASKIEISIIYDSVVISTGIIRIGTLKFIRVIKNFVFRKYKINITASEAKEILLALDKEFGKNEIKIHTVTVKMDEIQELLKSYFTLINDELLEIIELVKDNSKIDKVLANGFYFTGGGVYYKYLCGEINFDIKCIHNYSKSPLLDNINGLNILMTNKEKLKDYIITH